MFPAVSRKHPLYVPSMEVRISVPWDLRLRTRSPSAAQQHRFCNCARKISRLHGSQGSAVESASYANFLTMTGINCKAGLDERAQRNYFRIECKLTTPSSDE